jgi:hypothetical protein
MTAPTRRLVLLGVAALAATPGLADEVTLPDPDSGRMVLRFDIGPDRGRDAPPLLDIMANGRFSVRAIEPGAARVQGRLADGVLQGLVDYIVTTEGFLAINGGEISAQIKQISADGGPVLVVADAPTTRLTLDLGLGQHAVTLYATGFAARLFLQIDALQRLRRIEVHLLQLAEGLRGG